MPRIPEDILQRIRDATDIVDLISEHVQLVKKGRNYSGLCPFHDEKTPSFSVDPDRQFYHCFGCGVGGNVFKFIQEIDRVTFVEAVKFLAERTGIALPERSGPSREEDAAADELYRANDLAQKYFHHLLLNDDVGTSARTYLQTRRLSGDTIERFGLGYAPPEWDALLKVAGRRGLSPQILERAGLALPRSTGSGHYDRFRDRIAFPIANLSNRTIAFGARALQPDQEPKYLNSPETSIYHKGRVLYGLSETRDVIRRQDAVLVVEGYMDLISLAQIGIQHVVATSGTALTEDHCRLLARFARQVVLLFDGDAAGSTAAMRALEVLLGGWYRRPRRFATLRTRSRHLRAKARPRRTAQTSRKCPVSSRFLPRTTRPAVRSLQRRRQGPRRRNIQTAHSQAKQTPRGGPPRPTTKRSRPTSLG